MAIEVQHQYHSTSSISCSTTNLFGSASLQRQLQLITMVALPSYLASSVSVEICIGDAVELVVELEFDLHGTRGAVERRFRAVQENNRAEVVQLGDLSVQGGLLRQTFALVLHIVRLVLVVGLARRLADEEQPGHSDEWR